MVYKSEEKSNNLYIKSEKENSQIFERKQAHYKDLSEKFAITRSDYSKQFAHIYSARLAELRDILIPRVQTKWGMLLTFLLWIIYIIKVMIFIQ